MISEHNVGEYEMSREAEQLWKAEDNILKYLKIYILKKW